MLPAVDNSLPPRSQSATSVAVKQHQKYNRFLLKQKAAISNVDNVNNKLEILIQEPNSEASILGTFAHGVRWALTPSKETRDQQPLPSISNNNRVDYNAILKDQETFLMELAKKDEQYKAMRDAFYLQEEQAQRQLSQYLNNKNLLPFHSSSYDSTPQARMNSFVTKGNSFVSTGKTGSSVYGDDNDEDLLGSPTHSIRSVRVVENLNWKSTTPRRPMTANWTKEELDMISDIVRDKWAFDSIMEWEKFDLVHACVNCTYLWTQQVEEWRKSGIRIPVIGKLERMLWQLNNFKDKSNHTSGL